MELGSGATSVSRRQTNVDPGDVGVGVGVAGGTLRAGNRPARASRRRQTKTNRQRSTAAVASALLTIYGCEVLGRTVC